MKLDIKQVLQQFTKKVVQMRIILVWLLILGLLGFTLWRMQAVITPGLDEAYFDKRSREVTVPKINLDPELRTQLERLRSRPVDVRPGNLGTRDPFNP